MQITIPSVARRRESLNVTVNDLTEHVYNTSRYAIACGGFSDLYTGMLVRESIGTDTAGIHAEKVGIKFLRACTDGRLDTPRAKKRLNREVDILRRLDHPNIANFFGVSFHLGGHPSIVMKFYAHGDAPTYLKNRPSAERLTMVHGIVSGLCYLHTRTPAIVHGDLKGNNVLIDNDGKAVLNDFGLSKVLEDLTEPTGNTTSSAGAGTTRWKAPELIHDRSPTSLPPSGVTLASDVWAFACTVYELLSGNLPYSMRRQDWSVENDILHGVYPFSEEEAARYSPKEMWRALSKCWTPAGDRPNIVDLESNIRPFI